ncbi:hypothetical protein [Myxococcus sp. NMCA1]|nr:hypothetical protein [Myxococcus sp. NMCA1]WAM29927.1 hypothetical protein OZ403_18060 [Myxococcus sp. NMCA1]
MDEKAFGLPPHEAGRADVRALFQEALRMKLKMLLEEVEPVSVKVVA